MRRTFLFVVLGLVLIVAVVVVVAFMAAPPMRLMPAPLALSKGGVDSLLADSSGDPEIELFYATNRLPIGPRANRLYAIVPGRNLHLGRATIRIGEEGTPWSKILEWSTGASDDERPFLHLENLEEVASVDDAAPLTPEAKAWFAEINAALAGNRFKDLIVYVHGANTTFERAAGQAAQLYHFTGRNSVVVLFSWPTAENFLRYSKDLVTAFGSAPHLAHLIELLSANTDAAKIDVLTYSAGGTVGSEGLSIVGRNAAKPGAIVPRLGDVYHAAPDADFRAFVDDLADYTAAAERVTVAVNMSDSALILSQRINRASRAGRPDMAELSPEATRWLLDSTTNLDLELLRVRPENIPGLSRWSHTFWYEDPWVSSDVLITLLYHLSPEARGLAAGETSFGGHYWTFTPDYPERLAATLTRLQSAAAAGPGAGD